MADPKPPVTVTLSDGRIVSLREPKGRDVERGAAVARGGSGNSLSMLMGVTAMVATIDGKGVTYEDIQDWPMNDVFKVIEALTGNEPSPSQLSGTSS